MEPSQFTRLEKQITALSDGLANLATDKDFKELILIIRRPGWTTPAERMLVSGIVDTMLAQTKALAGLKKVLLTGSAKVGRK